MRVYNASVGRMLTERLRAYGLLMRLHRPVGIYLLLWPTLWSLWFASDGRPAQTVFIVFVLGVVLMRSAGCVINDYADRGFDAQVRRTRGRPLVSGQVAPAEALALAAVLILLAFACVLATNALTVLLSLVALALALAYPFVKRVHHLPQVHLGVAFGWAVPMAWAAQTGDFPGLVAWILFAGNVCWSVAYDTMYALADREDDLRIGVKSSAILFGHHDRQLTGVLQVAALSFLAAAGYAAGSGLWFYAGIAVAAGLSVYQQWLIRNRDPEQCLSAFTNNAWLGLAVFGGLFIDLLP